MAMTSDELITAARAWLQAHDITVDEVTKYSPDYNEFKVLSSALRELHNLSPYSWAGVNKLIRPPEEELTAEAIAKKYAPKKK